VYRRGIASDQSRRTNFVPSDVALIGLFWRVIGSPCIGRLGRNKRQMREGLSQSMGRYQASMLSSSMTTLVTPLVYYI
jgi:hypothetical protein